MMLDKKFYDVMKDVAQLWLPALATLYAAIAGIWSVPYAVEIPATIMALDTFLGVVLKLDSYIYNKEGGDKDGN